MPPRREFLIGELSERTGRSIHTIRWYEAQGLMPGVTRDAGGRRLYTPEHIEWLAFLGRLRASGMAIRDMRSYAALVPAGHRSLTDRQALLRAHAAAVDARMAELQAARKIIGAKLAYYAEWEKAGKRPAILPSALDP